MYDPDLRFHSLLAFNQINNKSVAAAMLRFDGMKPSQTLLIYTKVPSYIRFQVCQNESQSTPALVAVSLLLLFHVPAMFHLTRMWVHDTSSWPSFTSHGATRKASDTKERPKDTAEAPNQAKETAEVERGSRISSKGNADLQAPLRVAAAFVYPGAFHEVAHGAK